MLKSRTNLVEIYTKPRIKFYYIIDGNILENGLFLDEGCKDTFQFMCRTAFRSCGLTSAPNSKLWL